MVPDILGYKLDEGIRILQENGIDSMNINVNEYTSPKVDIIGDEVRIVRIDECSGRIKLIISNF